MSMRKAQRMSLLMGGPGLILAGCILFLVGCPTVPPPADGDGTQTGNTGLTGEYVGSERCSLCHVNTHTNWSETLHATALETLEAIDQGANTACLPCHTVGLGEDGGFVDRATTNDLAGVGCEACHGPSRDHVENVENVALRPTVDIGAALCGDCHTGEHHPTYEEWQESAHATVTDTVMQDVTEEGGFYTNTCGVCHIGDVYYQATLKGETVAADEFLGASADDLHAVTCAICHDPHRRTGNATMPDEGRDFQLRFPEVATPTATNTIAAAMDASRFNQCGQCHHSRGRDWTATDRGPHNSVQSNIYVGEMPMPAGEEPLVFSRVSVHSFAPEQCATCHMYREDFQSEEAPTISGHSFAINRLSCAAEGCHPSTAQAEAVQTTLQAEIAGRLADIEGRLDDWGDWEYSETGGPEDQDAIPDWVQKVRFLLKYAEADGSLGMHNPAYVRDLLLEADEMLENNGF
jgi:hypothetical protein